MALHGLWLLKGSITPEEFSKALAAARKAETCFAVARSAKAVAGKRFAAADVMLTSWLAKARLVIMLAYGSKWSESWVAAGFTHRGTNVPKRISSRMELGRRLAEFLAAHPKYEVAFAEVTAAGARRVQDDITMAGRVVRLASRDAQEKKRTRDTAERKLRREMHFVVCLLGCVLEKGDSRWADFGLNQPRPDDGKARRIRHLPVSSPATVVDFIPSAEPTRDIAAA